MLGIGEILRIGSTLEGQAQIDYMRKNWSASLGKMIEYALEPEFVWDLPPGRPPFNPTPYLDQEGNLYGEIRRMYIFMEDTGAHVKPLIKEKNFVQLLENVNADDAELLVYAKEKSLPWGWTAERLREIYPGLLSQEAEEHQPDLSEMTNEELGAPDEVIPEPTPLFLDEEALIQAALLNDAPVIVPPDQKTEEEAKIEDKNIDHFLKQEHEREPELTKKQLAMAKALAVRQANLAAKKLAAENSGPTE